MTTTDEKAGDVIIDVLADHDVDNRVLLASEVIDRLREAGIELFEAPPAPEALGPNDRGTS